MGLDDDITNDACFSKSTPKHLDRAIRRIMHPRTGGAPSSERIIQDVDRVESALKAILLGGGICITDEKLRAVRRGPRAEAAAGKVQRGGARTKKAGNNPAAWVHASLAPAIKRVIDQAVERFAS